MNRKKIVKIVVVVVAILGILFMAVKLQNNQDKKDVEDVDRFFSMQSFNEKEEIPNNPVATSSVNESPDYELDNRIEFIDSFSEEDMDRAISIINGIDDSFSFIPQISSDLKQFKTNEYYKANKKTIYKMFGINKYKDFKTLADKISKIGTPKKYYLDTDSIEDNITQVILNVRLKGNKGTVNIKLKVSSIDNSLSTSSITVIGE